MLLVDDVIATTDPQTPGQTASREPLYRYQYRDHLGSACIELDHERKLISYETYHPYGTTATCAQKSDVDAPPKRYRHSGLERDEESGLSYHRSRHNAPWLARWTTADPAGLADGLNRYAFVHANPIKSTDLQGTTTTTLRSKAGEP